jgi:hypothetical protein
MIHINKTSAINTNYLIFEFEIDDGIPVDYIKNESNYVQIKKQSRNNFNNNKLGEIKIKSLLESFSNENLYKIVNDIYESNKEEMAILWPFPIIKYKSMYEFIKQNSIITTQIFMDTPGFSLAPHFDNRFVFANFILNLVDNQVNTKFYDYSQNYKLIYEAPNEKGKGVFFLNYENSCHSYINDSFKNRYAIISTVSLKLF